MAGAAWLLLFSVLLIVPPPPGPRRGGGPGGGRDQQAGGARDSGVEPPAVISLLAGRLDKLGFGATLVDLAARGWFRVHGPAEPGAPIPGGPGEASGPGPAMCVVPAETPGGALAPFERRVLAHVALRAGAAGRVPAPALRDGFSGGEDEFMSAFQEEVDAEARRLGLTRARLTGRRIGLLALLLTVPAGLLAAAVADAHRSYGLAWAGGLWWGGFVLAGAVGASRRRSAAGQAALKRWRSDVAGASGGGAVGGGAPGHDRLLGYAVALGAAPAALAVFDPPRKNTAWSSYRGGWQQLEIETTTWSWPKGCLIPIAITGGSVAYVAAAIWLGTHGMVALAKGLVGLVVAGAVAGIAVWLARRSVPPSLAEFDGQVIRQWMVKGDSESPDEWHVAVDDGTREVAWDFSIGGEPWRRLTPGTFVHARVNLRDRKEVSVAPVEPPAVARPLAGVAADQQRAATKGLPDPEGLVTRDEAAALLGGQGVAVDGKHAEAGVGRTMIWQHAKTMRPMLRVEVRHAADARPAPPPGAWRAPGVADGYLAGLAGAVTVPPLIALLSIHGTAGSVPSGSVPSGPERLAGLLPVVEGRLRDEVARLNRGD
jgi:hypothetical protein